MLCSRIIWGNSGFMWAKLFIGSAKDIFQSMRQKLSLPSSLAHKTPPRHHLHQNHPICRRIKHQCRVLSHSGLGRSWADVLLTVKLPNQPLRQPRLSSWRWLWKLKEQLPRGKTPRDYCGRTQSLFLSSFYIYFGHFEFWARFPIFGPGQVFSSIWLKWSIFLSVSSIFLQPKCCPTTFP